MKKRICVISGAGAYEENDIKNMSEFIKRRNIDSGSQEQKPFYIAADGGIEIFKKEKILPDVQIGDFDSSNESDNSVTCDKVRLPSEKDDTDMLAAIRLGIKKGYREFHILGGMGKRLEHSLANIQCLNFLIANNARGYIYGDNRIITMIQEESFLVYKDGRKGDRKYISIFAYSDQVNGVTLEGFKYPLTNARLKKDYPIGVSNELLDAIGKICIKNGELLIVF